MTSKAPAANGYIKLYRTIQDNPEWQSEKFTRAQAWIDMLLSASYKPHMVRIRGIQVNLERGQLALSEVEYARRWKWSRNKVRRFLQELESQTIQQIKQQKTNVTSVVTILNYERYQGGDTPNDTASGTASGTAERQQKDTYKKGKKDKNSKEDTPISPKGKAEMDAELIYNQYPRKTGKAAAIKSILKAIKNGADVGELLEATQSFNLAVSQWDKADRQYCPHPATWFNQGRWEDDRDTWVRHADKDNRSNGNRQTPLELA